MSSENNRLSRPLFIAAWIAVLCLAIHLRTTGLFRGLEDGVIIHPDAAKQVSALYNYLRGEYVWYVGSLYYDGYPLSLNHIDEWILRPVLAVRDALLRHFNPDQPPPSPPGVHDLYYYVLVLRVLYGLLVVLLAYAIARMAGMRRPASLLAAFLVSLSPLAAVVMHSGTGDVGTDLFTALALAALGLAVRTQKSPACAALAGIMAGFAFAAKFQGALAMIAVAIFFGLRFLWLQRRPAAFFAQGLIALAGFAAGVLAAMPHFFINFKRTWYDLIANFVFIKNYDVSPEFLRLPFFERIGICLRDNTPTALGALGWTLAATALVGLAIVGLRLIRERRAQTACAPRLCFQAAIVLYPFAAIALALLGKPEVQPFHFSCFVLPLCLAAIFALDAGWSSPARVVRFAGWAMLAILLIEVVPQARREAFFWGKEDNKLVARVLEDTFIHNQKIPESCPQVVRLVGLEGPNLPVFRNNARWVAIKNGRFWNRLGIAPLPQIPAPRAFYWIFADGPSFPCNDRMFKIPAGSTAWKGVIFRSPPATLAIGVQSGLYPAQATLTLGGHQQSIALAPYESAVLRFPSTEGATLTCRKFTDGVFHVPLKVATRSGDLWASVLGTEKDAANYRLWTGAEAACPAPNLDETAIRHIESAAYLEGQELVGTKVGAGSPISLRDPVILPAGLYRLECDYVPLAEGASVSLVLSNRLFGLKGIQLLAQTNLASGIGPQTARIAFAKAFAPTELGITIECPTGVCTLGRWRLSPDVRGTLAALEACARTGMRPDWLAARPAGSRAPGPCPLSGIAFGNRIRLLDLQIPESLRPGDTNFYCAMRLDRRPLRHIEEYVVFLHFIDPQGTLRWVADFPLYQALAGEKTAFPIARSIPAELSPGDYEVWMGVYNARTGKRLPIRLPPGFDAPLDDDKVLLSKRRIS